MSDTSSEETDELIYQAVIYKNIDLLQELLKVYPGRVHYTDNHGRTALHIAARNGSVDAVRCLIEAGANVNSMASASALCERPLHVAAIVGNTEIVELLINAGAELLATDLNDHCALELAQMTNHFQTACVLIDAIEADRRECCRLHGRLITACIEGSEDVVREILCLLSPINSDAILNGTNIDHKCCLYIACLNGRESVVAELIKVSGHTLIQHSTHDSVLHAAISSQEPGIVRMILESFTHLVTTKNADGSTVLHWAAQCGNLDIVKLLMEFPYEEEMLERIEDASGRFSYRFVIDVNALDSRCRTALYLAVANTHFNVVKYMLESEFPSVSISRKCPFELDVYCSGGRTPLMIAAANANVPLVKLLLDHGADVNLPCALTDADISCVSGARCVGSGALVEACRVGCFPLVQTLVQHGAIDHENVALATAIKNEHDIIVRFLLCRLVFVDPDYRINKKGMDFGQMSFKRNFLPSTFYPTIPCMVNWHNTSISNLVHEWLVSACVQLNQKLKTSGMALAALTRIDVSSNNLQTLSISLLQLASLHSLNASNNRINGFEHSSEGFNAPVLETLNLEFNELTSLPEQLFSSRLPNLVTLDVSNNKLAFLPDNLWMAPKLKDLNVSHNNLDTLPVVTGVMTHTSATLPIHSHGSLDSGSRSDGQTMNGSTVTDDSLSASGRLEDANITIHELHRYNFWQTNVKLVQSDESDLESGNITSSSTLSSFNISHNHLKVLPPCLACCCPKLTRLNVSFNELVSLGAVECIPSRLRHLDASSNHLCVAFEPSCSSSLMCHAGVSATASSSSTTSRSPHRNPRSRSRSAVRSSRSLSVARVSDTVHDIHVDVCPHKQHSRLESLRTFQVAHNQLKEIPLIIPSAKSASPRKKIRESRIAAKEFIRRNLLFPSLTSLDVSDNRISLVPAALAMHASLSVLNLSGNTGIETLPAELGLLGKLWNLNLKDCSLRDPLRTMVQVNNYKTVDLIAYLKSILEDSRPYTRLKLMIVGVQGIGKTSLLQQLRLEGVVSRQAHPNDSWSRRMSRSTNGEKTAKGANISTVGVDISEWTFEPKKGKGEVSFGPLTFRTWDFGGQREYYATHQYFLSKRSLYIVVWKSTDGEAAIPDVHQWLINIQARAPNSPVIIVGTHIDQILANLDRFPPNYLEELHNLIREQFVMVPDADKKGLPRVVDAIFVSTKTRHNIRLLCNLLYRTAFDIHSAGSKERLLDQKIPASYLAFEKIVVNISDERRSLGIEPVMNANDFRNIVRERMLKNYGRAFRDDVEFNHACSFLHENGVLLHYEDVNLRDLYFLDPQWLCDVLAHVITIREINPFARNGLMKIDDLHVLFKTLKLGNSAINLKSHIISLLHKFEVALTWQSRSLLIPSLLPDEYQLRGGYSGCRVTVPAKISHWVFDEGQTSYETSSFLSGRVNAQSFFYQKNIIEKSVPKVKKHPPLQPVKAKNQAAASDQGAISVVNCDKGVGADSLALELTIIKEKIVRRLYAVAYIPSGFWSRLMTRILGDDHIISCIERLFTVTELAAEYSLKDLNTVCSSNLKVEWLLWQTGIELLILDQPVFSLRQFLPFAEVRDVHYEQVEWRLRSEDGGAWRTVDMQHATIIEIVLPEFKLSVVDSGRESLLNSNKYCITRLLALIVDIIDTLLEDWYPSLGTRFVHTSEGRLLVNRLIPCPMCADLAHFPASTVRDDDSLPSKTFPSKSQLYCHRSQTVSNFPMESPSRTDRTVLYAFSIEECILSAHEGCDQRCPRHGQVSLIKLAPDSSFLDIFQSYLIAPQAVKSGKMIGRGAFGFVFKATVKLKDQTVVDAALKMLEPVEPGLGARGTSISAYKAARVKWQRDPLQNACRAYCTCRQELNVLLSLQHSNITALIGVCPRPLALVIELAPLGSLNNLLSNYRRSGARLHLSVIQDTANQVARALEYLHEHRVIYRDLKCENVLVWRFPPPFSAINDVVVKLGDYGISRSTFPSGGAKGFGGTEGFMAPEIMRYNGEQEYTEKVDCFSFAMFLYELISLKLPFDGHEQVKEYILDGGRPRLTPSELLYPCNVLDVMVVCWATQPIDRPSASQLVSMTTAPEFTHLLDVISLNDADSSIHSTLSFPTVDENDSLTAYYEDNVEGEIWLSRSDGSITVLGCNQYGWLDSKSIDIGIEDTVITAMCIVNDTVWMAESTGLIRIICRNSYAEVSSFSIVRYLPDALFCVSVHSLQTVSSNLVLCSLPSLLLILRADRPEDNFLVSTATLTHISYKSIIVCCASAKKQIWIGQDDGLIAIYYLNCENQLITCSSVNHSSKLDGKKAGKVFHMVTSQAEQALVWTALSPGSKVYQWSCSEKAIKMNLDTCKILPSSESISTLDIEAAREGEVTALCLLDKTDGAQLYVGTNKGVIIVVQALQMRPLAAFRPYLEHVHSLIALDTSASYLETISCRRSATANGGNSSVISGTSIGGIPSSIGGISAGAGGPADLLETVSWMKDRVSETVSRFRLLSNDSSPVSSSYIISVGDGYRCLIDRFTDRKRQQCMSPRRESHCAIIWRTEDWIA